MAGRARGGKSTSLTHDQLQSMGVGKEIPQVMTAPPPLYPTLHSKPVTMETTTAQLYQILWKEDFLHEMRDSPYYIMPKVAPCATITQRYSEKWALENAKKKPRPDFLWHLMPRELRARAGKKRRRIKQEIMEDNLSKTSKMEPIEARLKVLEEQERNAIAPDDIKKDNSDSENEFEEMPMDEEMDDENDYGANYFDNGEAYNDEDDNLDDGPVF